MTRRLKLLAAVAHHGDKNRDDLAQVVATLRSLDLDVHIVVLVEQAKKLPSGVEQRVGLPAPDPHSLPFAHRQLFADRRDEFDLFLYAEDDSLVEQRHVDAFLDLTSVLPDDRIPGFQRYEALPSGERSYSTVHSHYRWDPESVEIYDDRQFAHFTNDHGAAYLLTRAHLRRAIASGGFLVEPHEGRYDMLVSAATDVYTQCGMRKVFCLDCPEDQIIHHLGDAYLGRHGVNRKTFYAQLIALGRIADGDATRSMLCKPETRMRTSFWDRHSYTKPNAELVGLVPNDVQRVLWLGTGSGAAESVLVSSGIEVVGIPIDCVLAAAAELRGVRVLPPRLPEPEELRDLGPFDALVCLDILPYMPDPVGVVKRLTGALSQNATVLATAPDHRRYALRNRLLGSKAYVPVPRSLDASRIARTDRRWLRQTLREAGVRRLRTHLRRSTRWDPLGSTGPLAWLLGNTVLAVGSVAGNGRSPMAGRTQARSRTNEPTISLDKELR